MDRHRGDQVDEKSNMRASGRALRLALVVALHLGLLGALLHIAPRETEVAPPVRMEVRTVEVPATKAPPPPPPAPPRPLPIAAQPRATPAAAPAQDPVPAFTVPVQPAPHLVVPATSGHAAPAATPVPPPVPVTAARFDADYLQNPAPAYPPVSRRMREEGRVLLLVRVSASGQAEAAQVRQSSGFERLDEAALAAVRQWRFVPARRGDEAVAASVLVPLVFRLD